MKGVKIKETYLLFLIVIGLISLAFYSTYALFTASTEITDVVDFSLTLTTDSSIVEYETVTVASGETKIIELNITNSYENALNYMAWYEMVEPSVITDDILLGLYTEQNDTPGNGVITSGNTLTLLVGITNYSESEITVNLGTAGSIDNSFGLSSSKMQIPSGWTKPEEITTYLVTAEFLEEHTVITTGDYYKEFSTPSDTAYQETLTPGTYTFEVWGAQGGSFAYEDVNDTIEGGRGGYSIGTLTLTEDTDIYVHVGGQNNDYPAVDGSEDGGSGEITGGINGGGAGKYVFYSAFLMNIGLAGGGATDIRIGQDSLYARVIVAGGGSGAYCDDFSSGMCYNGYAGGGTYSEADATSNAAGPTSGGGMFGYAAEPMWYTGGGGGWYGGYDYSGGSGYVYNSDTATYYPTGCLLDSDYYLEYSYTVGYFSESTDSGTFSNTAGTGTEEGHEGNGFAKITGTTQTATYTIPRVLNLTPLSVTYGSLIGLTDNVTYECETGSNACTYVGPESIDVSTLEVGTHTIYYLIKGADGTEYKYPRTLVVTEI